jgi:hypothetical protein
MKRDYKQKLISIVTLPEHHLELRIGESLLVLFLLTVLIMVLF